MTWDKAEGHHVGKRFWRRGPGVHRTALRSRRMPFWALVQCVGVLQMRGGCADALAEPQKVPVWIGNGKL